MTRSCVRPACLVFCLGLVFLLAEPIAAQVVLPIRMRAFAVNMSNNLTGANGIIQITLDQWSTQQERTNLLQTVPKGPGWNLFAYDLTASTFKSEATGWDNSGTVANLEQIKEVQVLIYHGQNEGHLQFDQIQFLPPQTR